MKYNKGKCEVSHLGLGNVRYVHRLGELESQPGKKDLEIPADKMLDMSHQCVLAAWARGN